jgi:hypothetical protein
MLRDRQSVVHVVTLLEEMPVQESADAVAELTAEGFGLGAVIVNHVREPVVDEALLDPATTDSAVVEARVRDDLAAVGVRASARTVTGLLSEARDHAERVALEHSLEDDVAALGLAVVTLPALPTGIEDGGVAVLADELAAQGVR